MIIKVVSLVVLLGLVHHGVAEDETEAKILNGKPAKIRNYPWMVGLQKKNSRNKWVTWPCGAALIKSNLVITDWKCINRGKDPKIDQMRCTIGSTRSGVEQDADGKTIRYVDHFNMMPQYDIIIFHLSERVVLSEFIQPIAYPGYTNATKAGAMVDIAGWGRLGHLTPSPKLTYTAATVTSDEECKRWYPDLKKHQMCVTTNVTGICGGDSGDPVVEYVNGTNYLAGVVINGTCDVLKPSRAVRMANLFHNLESAVFLYEHYFP